jgi:hypothetical protein
MATVTVDTLAATLQEPKRPLLTAVLRVLGQDRCAAILADTLTCEARGGMLTKEGTRRRTPGGVFFQLVRERATKQERRRLFPWTAAPSGPKLPQAPAVLKPGQRIVYISAEINDCVCSLQLLQHQHLALTH